MTTPEPAQARQLMHAEQLLWQASVTGTLTDLRAGHTGLDEPSRGASWGAERMVRAEVLAELLTSPGADREQTIRLRGARIVGQLDLTSRFLHRSLQLADCHFDEPVHLSQTTAPSVDLTGSHLPGLEARQLSTEGDLVLAGIVAGPVVLTRARVGGMLDLAGANIDAPEDVAAVAASKVDVGQGMSCNSLTTTGEVHLVDAKIHGKLELHGALIVAHPVENRRGPAFSASGAVIEQHLLGRDHLMIAGETDLVTTRVGGQLDLEGAALVNERGQAVDASSLTVGLDLLLRRATVSGRMNMISAKVGGWFSLAGTRLLNPGGEALMARHLEVGAAMACVQDFTAEGGISLRDAHIGRLDFTGAHLVNPSGRTLDARGMIVDRGAALAFAERPTGGIRLTEAHVGALDDDPATWADAYTMQGFVYESLENDEATVNQRLEWLTRDTDGYAPQLYDQLANVYRRAGDERAARRVRFVKQQRRRATLSPPGKALDWLLYLTVGYGYRTWLAAAWLAALTLVGTVRFDAAYPHDMVQAAGQPPPFDSLAYALDVLLPIADLGQQDAWQPLGTARYWSWAMLAAGWILTTAVVTGVTGLLDRRGQPG